MLFQHHQMASLNFLITINSISVLLYYLNRLPNVEPSLHAQLKYYLVLVGYPSNENGFIVFMYSYVGGNA